VAHELLSRLNSGAPRHVLEPRRAATAAWEARMRFTKMALFAVSASLLVSADFMGFAIADDAAAPAANAPSPGAPAQPASSASQAEPQPQAPPTATVPEASSSRPPGIVLEKGAAQEVLGKDVHSAKGEDMGHIINVLVDSSGEPRAAIVDFGGFLGVGSRKIAVDWSNLHFPAADKPGPVTLDVTRDEVKAAPEYKDGKPVVVISVVSPTDSPAPFAPSSSLVPPAASTAPAADH
jgi:hypothetical protein